MASENRYIYRYMYLKKSLHAYVAPKQTLNTPKGAF